MSAWFRFTSMMICTLFIACISPSTNAFQDKYPTNIRQKKLNSYSHLAAVTIYHWNRSSEIDNKQISTMIENLNIQDDISSEGIIFRHILATATANETLEPRVPIFVKSPLLDSHWQELKALNPELFSAAKAYYIYARAVNDFDGSPLRINSTVPALRRLKLEALDTGNRVATAIASIWLSMELTLASPIQAINEIEYSLLYLPTRSSTLSLENALDRATAHQWLRAAYVELSVPSRAYFHAMSIIEESNKNDKALTLAYFAAIDALMFQSEYSRALELANKALITAQNRNSEHEKFIILFQKLKVLLQGFRGSQESEINSTLDQLNSIDIDVIESKSKELFYLFQSYVAALQNRRSVLETAISNYKRSLNDSLQSSEFKLERKIRGELELSRLYDFIGDYEKAYEHSKTYNRLLVEKNTEQFKLSNSSFTDGIAKDIELARYRQKELTVLRSEKDGLSTDKEAMKTTIFALIITILIILALWLWISKRQSDLLAERDSLTGALTRRAMLNSLKKALKGNKASCIALLDVDNFKKINDKYGHVVGDEVLTTFTQIIKNRIRKSDKLCRYGGEEFLIYFSDSDQRSAKRILDELNFALSRQKHWSNTKEMFSVSFSSGLLDVNGETNLDTIIKMCDELLYRAKREGRARVASFPI